MSLRETMHVFFSPRAPCTPSRDSVAGTGRRASPYMELTPHGAQPAATGHWGRHRTRVERTPAEPAR